MKQKNLPLSLFAALLFFSLQPVFGQNCNLISSATFTVPNNSSTGLYGSVTNVVDSGNIYNLPIDSFQWQYIAISKDNADHIKVYKNGQLIFQGSFLNRTYSWSRFDLGAIYYTNYFDWFKGWLDEIRVSNVVRSDSDISNAYSSNSAFVSDASTVGLWHFDQNSGTTISATTGPSGSITNATWDASGKFGSSLYFNGTNAYGSIPISIPSSNMTFEFWMKPNTIQTCYPISWYGVNTTGLSIALDTINTIYTWSNGDTGTSVTVNPSQLPYLWVSNGHCKDTVFFNSQAATTHINVYDTLTTTLHDTVTVQTHDTITTYTAVTDTLLINVNLTGILPPNNTNVVSVYPNPAHDHLEINVGNLATMTGYSLKITNALGQIVFNSPVNQQQFYINLNTWSGHETYVLYILDPSQTVKSVKEIVLQ